MRWKGLGGLLRANYRRGVAVLGVAALAAVVATGASSAAGSSAPSASVAASTPPPPGGFITNFVKYVNGKAGTANPKLSPVKIGWASNDTGGSVISIGPEASAAAQVTVDWINKYADGIDGHPLVLDKCIVLNAEEEGLACAQKFLNDPGVSVISFGALSVGAQTLEQANSGKKPIIFGFALNASDVTSKNTFILFGVGGFQGYEFGTFAKQDLHAKACAVIYPNLPGLNLQAGYVDLACKYAGLPSKLVPFDPTTSDLTGTLTAAGATNPGTMVAPLVTSPSNCLSAAKAIASLGIKPTMVTWYTQCQQPSIKSQYPGGDYPKYYSAISQSGDALIMDPTGVAFKAALAKFGHGGDSGDDWYSGMFGQVMTIAQFMNGIAAKGGVSKITPAAMLAAVKAWKGPLLLGGPSIQCGKYKFLPGGCSDGNYFFHYLGNGQWARVSAWLHPPIALQKALEKLKPGAEFPTG
jgi:branched-chain amino acid transport system substrate-binding protein